MKNTADNEPSVHLLSGQHIMLTTCCPFYHTGHAPGKLTAVLTIKRIGFYKRIDNAREVSKRLLSSIRLLPEESSCCLYADFGTNTTIGAFAVHEDGEMLSSDDLKWIFDKCADVHEAPVMNQSIWEKGGCVYTLRPAGSRKTAHQEHGIRR